MNKYFQAGGLLICLGLLSGCGGAEVADPAASEFQGVDADEQMKAMEAAGQEAVDDTGAPAAAPAAAPDAAPDAEAQ